MEGGAVGGGENGAGSGKVCRGVWDGAGGVRRHANEQHGFARVTGYVEQFDIHTARVSGVVKRREAGRGKGQGWGRRRGFIDPPPPHC